MCGRYYMDDETVEEIEKVIRLVDAKVHNRADLTMLQVGDIHPEDLAPVIAGRNHEIQLEKIRWGIPKDDTQRPNRIKIAICPGFFGTNNAIARITGSKIR